VNSPRIAIVGALIAALSLVALPLLVVVAATGKANAATCTTGLQPIGNGQQGGGTGGNPTVFEGITQSGAGQVTVPLDPQGPQTSTSWNPTQVRNASTITNVARTWSLSPRAAVIAVATAMQESSLNNLDSGDADSLGLFQQRPSQGWGNASQLTDPVYASNTFYDVLVEVPDWQTKPLSTVAQAVQRSLYPGAYAKWEQAAGALVSQTWGTSAVTSISKGCSSTGTDPVAIFNVKNPRTPAQAIAAARREAGSVGWYQRCDQFVAEAYGWLDSGSETANIHWGRLVDAGIAHPGDNHPPAGALLFYDTGEPDGHVALYLGHDLVASNDVGDTYRGEGIVAVVHRSDITDGAWKLRYRGWAEPNFPGASGASSF
jgi:hypothetical protein